MLLSLALPTWAWAGPRGGSSLGKAAKHGLELAKSGDCVAAVPELEKAEGEEHRPVTAAALASCHVALGELLLAHEIYEALSQEPVSPAWDRTDVEAKRRADKEATAIDARIPRLNLDILPADAEVEVRIGGRKAAKPREVLRVPPDEKTEIVVSGAGFERSTLSVLLGEGESKRLSVTLTPEVAAGSKPKPKGAEEPAAPPDTLPPHWLGARFRGLFVPQPIMNIVGDGGRNAFLPGFGVTFSERLEVVDIEPSITVFSYNLGTTPFKPHGTPDTEWELVESDLWGAIAALDVLYRIPLDVKRTVELRIGGGFGIGWAFAGDLYRWQSFPKDGKPGDPSTYEKCKGPNDPSGTFRYCNQLDKDAERYGKPDATWSDGGARPVIYPWLALPEVSFAFRPVDAVAIDLEVGATLNGILLGTGLRFGL